MRPNYVLPPVLTDDARLPQRLPLASRSFGFLQRPPVALLDVFLGFWVLGLFLLLVPKVVFGFLKAINVVELSPESIAWAGGLTNTIDEIRRIPDRKRAVFFMFGNNFLNHMADMTVDRALKL